MINPSRALNAQNGCHLFKPAAETRNQIYELLFTIETNEDGSIEINQDTVAPSNALARTCQQIYNESHAMFKLASRDYATKYTFTVGVPNREHCIFIPAFSPNFLWGMESFRVNWRADEHNGGKPLRLTTHFWRSGGYRKWKGWNVCLQVHDKSWSYPNRRDIKDVTHV
jgi:hypothetical protein